MGCPRVAAFLARYLFLPSQPLPRSTARALGPSLTWKGRYSSACWRMNSALPSSRSLSYVTPSSAELLLRCPLRLSYANESSPVSIGSPSTWIGDAAHFSLEQLVKERGLWGESPAEEATRIFDEEVARRVSWGEKDMLGRWGIDPRRWPGFALKRARLARVAERLAHLLGNVPPDEVLAEVDYSAFDGRMRGRADLVVNAPSLHAVADYKTGRAVDEGHEPLPAFQRQVRLYCAMEEERSGSFPELGWLIPFDGPIVEVQVDSARCRALADEALDAFARYNNQAPGQQPGFVSTDNCPTCPYAPICPEFWRTPREGLPEGAEAVRGVAREVRRVELGGVSVLVEPSTSTIETTDPILVRNIPQKDHPAVEAATEGAQVSLVGLVAEEERGTYRLGRGGHMRVFRR